MARRNQQNQTFLETVVLGIFHVIGQLFKLVLGIKSKRKGLTTAERGTVIERRRKIEAMLQSPNVNELRQAVFEADKLVYFILDTMGFAGQSFAEKLRSAEQSMDKMTYNTLWQGHKVRNQLAHESDVEISEQALRDAAGKLLGYTKSV